jgi:MADS-box transcription factor
MGKKDMDDEDEEDEEMVGVPRDSHTPPEHALMPHHMQNPQFQHIRHATPSASPPMQNGMSFPHRHPSPQPGSISRPDSRTAHIRRPSSNLAPPQHQPPQPPTNYAYMPNPPFYNPQVAQAIPPKPPGPPQFQYTHPPPTHSQVQYMQQEQRRQSMPPASMAQSMTPSFPQQQPQPQPQSQPQPPQPTLTVPSPPQPDSNNFQSPPLPQPKPMSSAAKHSIFTPIDESRSMLGALWKSNDTEASEHHRGDASLSIKTEFGNRTHSIDVAVMSRPQMNGNTPPRAPPQQLPPPQRTQSTSSAPTITASSRANSIATDVKRPRLTVQIPSEHSDAGSATADSSPKDSGTTGATPARTSTDASHSSGVLLPPPSPSAASSLLSAGASGPPNPFARPPPPANNGSYGNRNEMETPGSALPSRFIENGLLPSPSAFYAPEWGFGRDTNMLPSPLNFQTPVISNGPSFARDDSADRKRKTSEEGSDGGGGSKRIKS